MTHISFKDLTNDFKDNEKFVFNELMNAWDVKSSDLLEYRYSKKVIYFSSNYSSYINSSDPIDILPFVMNNNINDFVLYDDLSLYVEYKDGKKSIYHIESVYELNNYLG